MNEQFIITNIRSIVSEPDYVGANGTHRSPIKMLLGVLIVSIAICGIAMNLVSGYMDTLGHIFWIVFHILYIGGLVYYFGKKWRYNQAEQEV